MFIFSSKVNVCTVIVLGWLSRISPEKISHIGTYAMSVRFFMAECVSENATKLQYCTVINTVSDEVRSGVERGLKQRDISKAA